MSKPATVTIKRTARLLSRETGMEYSTAREKVSEAITDLNIQRFGYHEGLHCWEISAEDSARLVEHLAEMNS